MDIFQWREIVNNNMIDLLMSGKIIRLFKTDMYLISIYRIENDRYLVAGWYTVIFKGFSSNWVLEKLVVENKQYYMSC